MCDNDNKAKNKNTFFVHWIFEKAETMLCSF